MGVPLYVICRFSLVAFNILSLSLIFVSLIVMCLRVFLLELILPATLCASWTCWFSLSHVREVFSYYFFMYFLRSFLSVFSYWESYNVNVCLMLSQRCLRLSSFLFILFFYILWQWFPPFCSLGHLSVLPPQLFCYGFCLVYYSPLFFSSCRSLVNVSSFFSIFASILF